MTYRKDAAPRPGGRLETLPVMMSPGSFPAQLLAIAATAGMTLLTLSASVS